MAVVLIGVTVVAAGAIVLGVFLWRRSRHRALAVLGAPAETSKAATPIHPEFALQPAGAPTPTPSAPPARESYYAQAPPSRAKGRPMGWYSVNGDYGDERYWDGRTWTARRQMVAGVWSSVPISAD